MNDLLKISGLTGGYGDVTILHELEIIVPHGKIVTIVGPNGAGKSTLLKAVYGIAQTSAGIALFDSAEGEIDLLKLKTYQFAGKGIGYVPQIENIFPTLTVEANLDIGALHSDGTDLHEKMYEQYPDLATRKKNRAGDLSGGQRQMLALARALMSEPKLLLLDEPSAGLAPGLVDQLFDELVRINERGVSILMVEQNARRALEISDHGYVLDMGRNRHEGGGKALAVDPSVVGIYFGKK
jgi:ABC-type branched-subunit amino acid transport system ATPase component